MVLNQGQTAPGKGSNFAISPGTLTVIVGSPGSGKSNLLKLATGLLQPAAGVITVNGQPLDGPARHALLRRTVYLSHEDKVLPLSLSENIAFGTEGTEKVPIRSLVSNILDVPIFRPLKDKFKAGVALTKCALVKYSVFGCGNGDIGDAALEELKKNDVQQEIVEPSEDESQKILA